MLIFKISLKNHSFTLIIIFFKRALWSDKPHRYYILPANNLCLRKKKHKQNGLSRLKYEYLYAKSVHDSPKKFKRDKLNKYAIYYLQ